MRRREFIALVGGAAAAWPLAARAQQPERDAADRRAPASGCGRSAIARSASRRSCRGCGNWAGLIGRNVHIDYRWGAGDAERIRKHAAELVALAPDVIVASGASTAGAVATGDPHRADRIRVLRRSGQRRLRR